MKEQQPFQENFLQSKQGFGRQRTSSTSSPQTVHFHTFHNLASQCDHVDQPRYQLFLLCSIFFRLLVFYKQDINLRTSDSRGATSTTIIIKNLWKIRLDDDHQFQLSRMAYQACSSNSEFDTPIQHVPLQVFVVAS